MNRSKELTAGYKKTSVLAKEIRGKRRFNVSLFQKTKASPKIFTAWIFRH